jgi:hypothetical protein
VAQQAVEEVNLRAMKGSSSPYHIGFRRGASRALELDSLPANLVHFVDAVPREGDASAFGAAGLQMTSTGVESELAATLLLGQDQAGSTRSGWSSDVHKGIISNGSARKVKRLGMSAAPAIASVGKRHEF